MSSVPQFLLHSDWITHSPGDPTEPPYFSATSLDTRWCYAFVAGLGLISWNYIPDSGKWDDSGEYRLSGEGESLGNQGVAENNLNIQVKVGIVIEVGPGRD